MKQKKIDWFEIIMIVLVVVFLLIIFSGVANAQSIGVNGAGYFENTTAQSEQWIEEAVQDNEWVLRITGGAIAKFADPLNGEGWGLTYEGIDSILALYGNSEEEDLNGAKEKWHRKADAEQGEPNYLDEVVELSLKFPKLKVIYCANIYIPTERAIYPINYLVSRGVNVVGVEMGNETYSQLNYSDSIYLLKIESLSEALRFQNIDIYHPCPALGLRNLSTHQAWADSLSKNTDLRDGICFHPYYDGREFSALKQPVDTAAAYGQISVWDFDEQFQDMKSQFPNREKFIVTETNTQPSSLIGDTEISAFFISRLLESGKKNFDYFCLHSGVAPDKYGIIYGTKTQKRNTSYFAFADAFTDTEIEGDTLIDNCRDTMYQVGFNTTIIPVLIYNKDTTCIKRFLRKRFCYIYDNNYFTYDTILTPIYASAYICDTTIFIDGEDTDTIQIPEDRGTGLEPITDWEFANPDIEIGDKFTGTNNYVPCTNRQVPAGLPDRANDDYLHDEKYIDYIQDGCYTIDHMLLRKSITTIVPYFDEIGTPIGYCGINQMFRNPVTGETVMFYDVWDFKINGVPTICNINKYIHDLWGFSSGNIELAIKTIHTGTGIEIGAFAGEHGTANLRMEGL